MVGYVQYGDRFIPPDMLYVIENPEAAERQRIRPVDTPPRETLELFDTRHLRGSTRSPEHLYRDATDE